MASLSAALPTLQYSTSLFCWPPVQQRQQQRQQQLSSSAAQQHQHQQPAPAPAANSKQQPAAAAAAAATIHDELSCSAVSATILRACTCVWSQASRQLLQACNHRRLKVQDLKSIVTSSSGIGGAMAPISPSRRLAARPRQGRSAGCHFLRRSSREDLESPESLLNAPSIMALNRH